jgi:PilZ domain
LQSFERRSTGRFKMKLPLTVRWTSGSAVGEASTTSHEVSSRGLSFPLPGGVKVGTLIEIVMTLPHEITMAGPVHVRCLGRVLRLEARADSGTTVAAAIDRYEFLREPESAA